MPSSRTKTRRDGNQAEFCEDMHTIGATAVDLSSIGGGCPDVLVGWYAINWLFELKNPDQPPSKRRPRKTQVEFKHNWKGQYLLVETSEDAMQAMGVPRKLITQMTMARQARRELAARIAEAKKGAVI